MKIIQFPLTNPVTLIPIAGKTDVTINTTGKVLVTSDGETATSQPRVRYIKLSETDCSMLSSSPKGLFRTVRITLPVEHSSETEFHLQVTELFRKVLEMS